MCAFELKCVNFFGVLFWLENSEFEIDSNELKHLQEQTNKSEENRIRNMIREQNTVITSFFRFWKKKKMKGFDTFCEFWNSE